MAPTEILAEQHYRKLASVARRPRRADRVAVRVAAREGSAGRRSRRWRAARAPFAIGTHALFQEGVELPKLGLAIIDEQHRFGVAQRLALRGKGLAEAHQLMMSATPIPRTLAMTFYADLDVVGARRDAAGAHAGRHAPRQPEAAREIVAWVGKACAEGRQAYWVCPLIEESEKLELQTAVALHAELTAALPDAERRPAARPDEARRQGGDDGGVRRAATSTCSSRPR